VYANCLHQTESFVTTSIARRRRVRAARRRVNALRARLAENCAATKVERLASPEPAAAIDAGTVVGNA
jgi:hypothetical protein